MGKKTTITPNEGIKRGRKRKQRTDKAYRR